MLNKKLKRDILKNKSQFLTIFLMVAIGVMVYTGIESYMAGMNKASEKFYSSNNLEDLTIYGSFTYDDEAKVKKIDNVTDAEKKLVLNMQDASDKDKNYLASFIESNNISKFYVASGKGFDVNNKGVWVDSYFADENNLKLGDKLSLKYDDFTIDATIEGFIMTPDHLYDVKDASSIMPDRKSYGFVYLSINALPKKYFINKFNLKSDVDYKKYIPYNYIMVDVNKKENVSKVKESISNSLKNTYLIQNVEDSLSYSMYEGEVNEGQAYVGIFSGLFLFIAILSVITTMSRIIKSEQTNIGILKSLGFSNKKITIHYLSYGFWVSFFGVIFGILLGKYFLGSTFLSIEMAFFEIPKNEAIVSLKNILISFSFVIIICLVTYLTCKNSLNKLPALCLRKTAEKTKKNINLNKGIFKKMKFSYKWNIRDAFRNKVRTLTGILGIVGSGMLILCAIGMLNSMNYFINLQFEKLYNFDYKLALNSNISDSDVDILYNSYGKSSSMTKNITLLIDNKDEENEMFVTNADDKIRFVDGNNEYIKLDSDKGIYVTYKLKEKYNLEKGDKLSFKINGSDKVYKAKIIGFNKDPQNQNVTVTKAFYESLDLKYTPDAIYTNVNLKDVDSIKNVEIIQSKDKLKEDMESMLSMMREMIIIIILFAIVLGSIIIYNMGILSYNEKTNEFATLKVLGFSDNKIGKIFIIQNIWITILSIILAIPSGYYLTSYLFKKCLDENFDFGVHINIETYFIASIGTFILSYIVSLLLSKKIHKINMVECLKSGE